MEKSFSRVQVLTAESSKYCLKFSHSTFVLVIISFFAFGCGRAVNAKRDGTNISREVNFLMMENQCNENAAADSRISSAIKDLFLSTRQNFPQSFYFINPRLYNYDTPLILSLENLEKSFQKVKNDPLLSQNGEDLYFLYQESRRFEDQKCNLSNLSQKKKYDIRPFLNIAHNCYKKYASEDCEATEYLNMSPEKEAWVKSNTVELCKSFSKEVNCQAEYIVNKRGQTLGKLIQHYYKRFQEERYESLFKLRPGHQSYHCQKTADATEDKTVMIIKILDSSIDHDLLVELLAFVEATWSRSTFALKLELVKNYEPNVVVILPTNKGISYVPDNNNRLVYLSTVNDLATMKRVLAHEFGHVLGFPDCYIEFFDESKKELVYYEISKNNSNIMCSLKNDVRVADDYFTQLTQNSCLFK